MHRRGIYVLCFCLLLSCAREEPDPLFRFTYGEEVALSKHYKIKLTEVWDSRADSINTTYVYPGTNFGVKLQWVVPYSAEKFSLSTACYGPNFEGIGHGTSTSHGYLFSIHSIVPAPRKNIPLEAYEVIISVTKK